jgi:putative ABC transport system permease protein
VFIMNLFSGSAAQDVSYWSYNAPVNTATVGLRHDTTANGINQPQKPAVFPDASSVARALDKAYTVKSAVVLSSVFTYPRFKGQTVPTPRFTTANLEGYEGCAGPACGDSIWIGSERALAAVIGHPLTSASKAALESGGVVSLYSVLVRDGRVTLDWKDPLKGDLPDHGQYKVSKSIEVPAALQEPDHRVPFEVMMLPATAQKLGLTYQRSLVMAPLGHAPAQAQTDRANAELDVLSVGSLNLQIETGPTNQNTATQWGLLALSALIALASATIAIALARADGRRDSAVLGSLGAPPTTRRAFGFWQAIILAGVGSVIGVVLGLVPSIALSIPDAQGHALDVFAPAWPQLAMTLVGIPLVIAVGAWLTAGRGRSQYIVRAPID